MELLNLALDQVEPDPDQPRKDFDEEALQALAADIRLRGVRQPINVRAHPRKNGLYLIVSGERRWRASKLAEKFEIPAILDSAKSDRDTLWTNQINENLQREDFNPVELAESIQGQIDALTARGIENPREVVAGWLHRDKVWMSKTLAVLTVGQDLRSLAMVGKIRKYELLKKVDALKGEKRGEALKLIAEGSFNSVEFFKRKRYDKKVDSNATDPNRTAKVGARGGEGKSKHPLSLSEEAWLKLFDLLPETPTGETVGEKLKTLKAELEK